MTTLSIESLCERVNAKVALQQPTYPDQNAVNLVTDELRQRNPVVTIQEIKALKDELAAVSRGEAIIIQGGECAESSAQCNADSVRKTASALQDMAHLVQQEGMKVVTIARIGGQSAKPRSSDTETRGDVTLPSYRGDMVNSADFTEAARVPDPANMVVVNNIAQMTSDVLRCPTLPRDGVKRNNVHTSHEGLLMPYEQASLREDEVTGKIYATSGAMLWIGERTRQLDGAHVEMFAGIENPIGVKIGPKTTPDDVRGLVKTLNPKNEEGRLVLITRMGDKIGSALPPILEAVKEEGDNTIVISDPVHGNTVSEKVNGITYKTRHIGNVVKEITSHARICQAHGVHQGGVHLEMTADTTATECIGMGVEARNLPVNYRTPCDPCLNGTQARTVAAALPDLIGKKQPTLKPYAHAL